MKKMKMLYLVTVLALLSVVLFSGIAQAGAVPEGFMGVPWGASKAQVIKAMSEQGCQQITHPQFSSPDTLVFNGSFAGASCPIIYFSFIRNSFYEGKANYCNKSPNPAWPQVTYKNIVDMLSEKYGPPTNRSSETERTNDGKEHPLLSTIWNFVDNRSSDKYFIIVSCHVGWFRDTTGDQYMVDVYYRASSLEERLKKNAKNLY